jgi:hypothetical protein
MIRFNAGLAFSLQTRYFQAFCLRGLGRHEHLGRGLVVSPNPSPAFALAGAFLTSVRTPE